MTIIVILETIFQNNKYCVACHSWDEI